jgi:hypothetical protein
MDSEPVPNQPVLERLILRTVEAGAAIMGLDHRPTVDGTVRFVDEYPITGIGKGVTNTHARVPDVDYSIAQTKLDYTKLWTSPEAKQLRDLIAVREHRRGPRERQYVPGSVVGTIIHNGCGPWVRQTLPEFARTEAVGLREFLASDSTRVLSSAPLKNFDCPGRDRVSLTSSVWLRRLSQAERSWLLSNDRWKRGHQTVLDLTEARRTAWAIEAEYFLPETLGGFPGRGSEDYSQEFDRVVSGLRLFKAANIGRCGITDFEEPFHRPMWLYTHPHYSTTVDPFGPVYLLDSAEVSELVNFFGRYSEEAEWGATSPLSRAIQRFNDTFYHERPEERELDCVIALDCLLGTRERGMTRKFASRGSTLFAKDPADKVRLSKLLAEAYGRRSSLVHDGLTTPWSRLEELVARTREAVRAYLSFPPLLRDKTNLPHIDEYARLKNPGVDVGVFVQQRLAGRHAKGGAGRTRQ